MNKADKVKLLYIFSISLMLSLIGCVDTGVQIIDKTFDYQSQIKVGNLASVKGGITISRYI